MTEDHPKTITYPPELLPSPDDGESAEVVVVHPDTGRKKTVFMTDDQAWSDEEVWAIVATRTSPPGTPSQE